MTVKPSQELMKPIPRLKAPHANAIHESQMAGPIFLISILLGISKKMYPIKKICLSVRMRSRWHWEIGSAHKQDYRRPIADFQVEIIVETRNASNGDIGPIYQGDGIKGSVRLDDLIPTVCCGSIRFPLFEHLL